MAFSSGSIASATPHTALSTQIQLLFGGSGVANWSFVENIPAGTGTGQSGSASYSIDVYKCAGSGTDANDAATDWYVAFRIPVTDGAVSTTVSVFEDYEGGTNKRFKRPVATTSVTAPTGTGYWRSDSYAVAASVTGVLQNSTSALNTTGFNFWIKLTNNLLVVSIKVGASAGVSFLASLGDTLVNPDFVTDPCPLFLHGQSGTGGAAFTSREPGITDGTLSKYGYTPAFWTETLGTNATNGFDLFADSKVDVSRIVLRRISGINLVGGLRALLKSDLLVFNTGGTVNVGDTVDIDGTTYVVMSDNSLAGVLVAGGHLITSNT